MTDRNSENSTPSGFTRRLWCAAGVKQAKNRNSLQEATVNGELEIGERTPPAFAGAA